MGSGFRLLLCLLFAFSFSGLPPFLSSAAAGLVAEVDGVPGTDFELQREFQRMIPMQVHFHQGISQDKLADLQRQALDRLIERALKVRYALAQELRVDNAVLEARMTAIRGKFQSSETFKKALGAESVEQFRASLYRQLLADTAEATAVDAQIHITDDQVRDFYAQHKTNYRRPRQFKASQILIKVDPASNSAERAALRRKAEGLLARARAGEDFYNLAYYHSDDRSKYVGGDLGYFHEGQTVKDFEDELKKLQPGEISRLIETMYGYHIVKLVASNPPRQMTFAEMQEKIRRQLEKAARDKRYTEWLADLRNRYPVRISKP